jgi:hypothetical protein
MLLFDLFCVIFNVVIDMRKYESRITNMLLNMLDSNVKFEIDDYVEYICNMDFVNINSVNDIYNIFGDSIINFISNLTEDEKLILRSWTGYNFKNVNAILRGNWNYEINGRLTDENSFKYRKLASLISNIIDKYSLPKVNFISYRGVSLDAFSEYGITDINELNNLTGKFMYELGFSSTSLLSETSYFNKDIGDGKKYNIQLKYLISEYYDSGTLLINNDLSYSINQNEYLINKDSLLKIVDVKLKDDNAFVTVVPIPNKIWNRESEREYNGSKSK